MIQGEIVQISKEINPEKQEKAENTHKEILVRTIVTANNLIELGKLFKQVRDEKLYKLLGADSFGEYCGFPEISFGRSTIYSFIYVYELFVLKLNFGAEYLSKIGHRKLQIISPIVGGEYEEAGSDPHFWLDNANVLSESDLINAVRSFQGKEEMLPRERKHEDVYPFLFENYLDFIGAHPCIICEKEETDNAHFPRSKGAGGRNTDCIPLCRKCHSEAHNDFYDFLWLHKDKIFRYFYDTFLEAFAIIKKNE